MPKTGDFTVEINAGPMTSEDNIVLFCNEVHIEFELHDLPGREGVPPGTTQTKWVVLVPNNGHQRGELCKYPFERLVKISERGQDGPTFSRVP